MYVILKVSRNIMYLWWKSCEEPIMEEVSSNATSISIHDDDVNVYGLDGEDHEYGEESKDGTYVNMKLLLQMFMTASIDSLF